MTMLACKHRDKQREICLQDICLCLLYTSCLKIYTKNHVLDPRAFSLAGSSYLRILCKIHVSDSSTGLDHVYLKILCKIHVSGSISQQPYVFQDPPQDPRLRIHVAASLYLTDPLQDPCLRIHVSASSYLRILCKIHVSDSCLSIHQNGSSRRSTSSDSCRSIFVSHGISARPMSPDPCRSIRLYLRIFCKIHVSGVMSQHLCISGSSARSMSPDPCLSIFISQELLQDPCLRFMS